jgi:hypothetical protein
MTDLILNTPTFPKWPAALGQIPLISFPDQVFRASEGMPPPHEFPTVDCMGRDPASPRPAARLFSATGRLVLPLSFAFLQFQLHAHHGGARNRRIAARKKSAGVINTSFRQRDWNRSLFDGKWLLPVSVLVAANNIEEM